MTAPASAPSATFVGGKLLKCGVSTNLGRKLYGSKGAYCYDPDVRREEKKKVMTHKQMVGGMGGRGG